MPPKKITKTQSSRRGSATKKSGTSRKPFALDTSQSNLLIVESPAKAKTIKKYVGAGYEVVASMGHIVDLPSKGMGIDIANGFAPTYEVDSGKKSIVTSLKKATKTMRVWLATDEDREGEAIARHLARELGLDIAKTPRIVFHEITQSALQEAIAHPRTLDLDLVDAQQARRVLDRLVGYELSPVLRKKIKTGLSAGRVQSVAVKLVVDRERDITSYETKRTFVITGQFVTAQEHAFRATFTKPTPTKQQALSSLTAWAGKTFVVDDIVKKPGTKNPSAPFTTSSLQQEASRRLGYPVGKTMQLAQRLYELGHITYMRTDSIQLSKQAIAIAAGVIKDRRGVAYHQARNFTTKSASAQEAHEAIRPTHLANERAGDDDQQKKLYHLIRQRTLASQMSPAQVEKTEITLFPEGIASDMFLAKGEVVTFPGFLTVYGIEIDDEKTDTGEDNQQLPLVRAGDLLSYTTINATETLSKPAARFTEAMLVKALEENGIGRPSTYAPTISTIQQRGYVERRDFAGAKTVLAEVILKGTKITEKTATKLVGGYKGRLVPTDMGMVVTDFLLAHFPTIIDEQFTAQVEQEFDSIATGKLQRQQMLGKFYGPFHATVSEVTKTAQRASGERVLGTHPDTGKIVKVRIGRFGPLVQIAESDDPSVQFASLPSGSRLETITLVQALDAFLLPHVLGVWHDKEIKANTGRFGPYVQWGSTFASLPKGADPMTVSYDDAVQLLEVKIQKDIENTVGTYAIAGKEAIVKKGRRGYFVSYKRKKYALPKGIDIKTITEPWLANLLGSATKEPVGKKSPKKPSSTKKRVVKKSMRIKTKK